MVGSFFLLPVFLALLVSFLVVRAGAIALMMTGVEKSKAGFQALSAFSGTGFTTREAETVVTDPKRRRIISWLMVAGNIGVVTVIVSATSSLVASEGFSIPANGLALIAGAAAIYWFATRKGLNRRWDRFIEKRLVRSGVLEEASAEDLLHFLEGYGMLRGLVERESSLLGETLSGLNLTGRGVLVLGIERGNRWIPIPRPDEVIKEGDRVVVYGPLSALRTLFEKRR
jgi:hypothetical protein